MSAVDSRDDGKKQASGSSAAAPDSATLVEIYRRAILCKLADERVRTLIKAGRLMTPYYSPRGQEIIPAAVSVNLKETDYIVTTYRGIADQLAKGVPLRALFAEYAGRVTGSCKGKGGPMHITHPPTGVMVTTGIVGSTLPIANGLAWASQIRGDGRVAVAYFGDGATNIGAFHESLNLASLWKLPVVFVCQNNGYAEHTRFDLGTSADRVADRAASYKMPGFAVDGNDPVAMWGAARSAIERARAGAGPTLIDAATFRFFGHLLGDMDEYMREGEKQRWIDRDPVVRQRAALVAQGMVTEAQLLALEAEINGDLDDAIEFALAGDPPDPIELRRDVFKEEIPTPVVGNAS
jgi:acetoin:2,6-dichlorophenolindophenol oxidoreductase subunit alpha